MNLIRLEDVSKSIGEKHLFSDVTFTLETRQKVALVGLNGCGKSTLLQIIAGTGKSDSGVVSHGKETRISYLGQKLEYNGADTVIEHIFSSDGFLQGLVKRYESVCFELATNDTPALQKELQDVMDLMDTNNAWEYEHLVKSVLTELEITDLAITMDQCSGGMIKKIALAQVLITPADLLILDEPTNHLDIKTIMYLEQHLVKSGCALLMVTHDRYFLDRVCNTIVEISNERLVRYNGNYSYYLQKKSETEFLLQREDARKENLLKKELEWYRRQPKARTSKSKIRMESIESLMKRDRYRSADEVEISISGRRLGKKILEVDSISKSFDGNLIIDSFSHVFKRGEKIGIIGPNGSGKTTLLNILTGVYKPDSGLIDAGVNTTFGYFTQNSEKINPDVRVLDYIKESAEYITLQHGSRLSASKMLEKFLFDSNAQYRSVGNLSGGERRRLYLLKILIANPNFLVLDEPTNDLDTTTLTILENFLDEFPGCLLIVTHDRFFMNRTVDRLLVFNKNCGISLFPGNYNDYLEYQEHTDARDPDKKVKPETRQVKNGDSRKEKVKLTFKEKEELKNIEETIFKLEEEKCSLDSLLSSSEIDHEKIADWSRRYSEIESELEKHFQRWEYLASFEM
jgi:ATP-binding cassette subfamily F protein uup